MANALDKFTLYFEDIKGYTGGIKDKIKRKIKPHKHPFLKEQKLVKNWGDKLAKTEKVKSTKRSKAKKTR